MKAGELIRLYMEIWRANLAIYGDSMGNVEIKSYFQQKINLLMHAIWNMSTGYHKRGSEREYIYTII